LVSHMPQNTKRDMVAGSYLRSAFTASARAASQTTARESLGGERRPLSRGVGM
jgi:hypothetical protein